VYFFGGATRKHGEGGAFFVAPAMTHDPRDWPTGSCRLIQSEIVDVSFGAGVKGKAAGWNWKTRVRRQPSRLRHRHRSRHAGPRARSFAGRFAPVRARRPPISTSRTVQCRLAHPLKSPSGRNTAGNIKIEAGEPDSYRDGGVLILDGPNVGLAAAAP